LGGMLALPCSDWTEAQPTETPPITANWEASETVRHTFTHFHLVLQVKTSRVDARETPSRGGFVQVHDLRASTLPTVMRKAYRSGSEALGKSQ
ncbi:MAG: NUDIX domain-containing protein, partial [Alphaproteobacteria bacterium]